MQMADPAAADMPDAPVMRWQCCPLRDEYPRSLGFVAAFVGVSVAVGVAFGGVGYGLLATGLLAVALARYYLPTAFRLDADGAAVRFCGQTRRLRWAQVRRVVAQRGGVFLSPFAAPSRLDSFRGMFLRFAGNGDEVTGFVRDNVEGPVDSEAA